MPRQQRVDDDLEAAFELAERFAADLGIAAIDALLHAPHSHDIVTLS